MTYRHVIVFEIGNMDIMWCLRFCNTLTYVLYIWHKAVIQRITGSKTCSLGTKVQFEQRPSNPLHYCSMTILRPVIRCIIALYILRSPRIEHFIPDTKILYLYYIRMPIQTY